jgi:molybdate transport system substrate-binding protein
MSPLTGLWSSPCTARRQIRVVALLLMVAMGCDGPAAQPLRIAAASDLSLALPKIADQFRLRTGIETSITFGSSGQLKQQIDQGAPFDLFLAANQTFVRDLADAGIALPDSVIAYARGSLVLAVYRSQQDTVRTLGDLTRPDVKKIALANPATAPYGKAGKQALERAGLWKVLEPKIVFADSVRQALLYVQAGDAEAALVGRALVPGSELRPVDVAPDLYDPIIQALGVVAKSSRINDAQQFARFMLDPDGQDLLKQFGFAPADVPARPDAARLSRPSNETIAPESSQRP